MSMLKKISGDMLLNIIAAFVPSAVLQLLVLPLVASGMTDQGYGEAIAVIALFGSISLTLGNVCNNVRLLNDKKYHESDVVGDFLPIVFSGMFINSALICLGTLMISRFGLVDVAVIVLSAAVMFVREYSIVQFRLELNYSRILISNLIQAAGYLVGYFAFVLCAVWSVVYLTGYLISLLYIAIVSDVLREPLKITAFFKDTLKDVGCLSVSGLLNKITAYADRLLLIPLSGGSAVAIYYVSSLFGKILSLLVNPVNNVILSYLVKENKKSSKAFFLSLGIGFLLCGFGFLLTLLISDPLLRCMYPQYVDEAVRYIIPSSLAAYVMVLTSIANPFVMRFCNLKWQIFLNGAFCAVFFGFGILGFCLAELMGFCIAVLLANVVKLVLIVLLFVCRARSESLKA